MTALRSLTKEEWNDVRGLAATVTGYDPVNSPIKGQTTIQLLQSMKKLIDGADDAGALLIIDELVRREAYNTFIGVESKKRRRN